MTGMPNSEHELPSPISGGIDLFSPEGAANSLPASPEKPLIPSDKEPNSEGAPKSTPIPAISVQATTTPIASNPTADGSDLTISTSTSADADVIEKVWVDKAKKVIEETRTNPGEQVKILNNVKAEYQKKRFNRDFKIDEKS